MIEEIKPFYIDEFVASFDEAMVVIPLMMAEITTKLNSRHKNPSWSRPSHNPSRLDEIRRDSFLAFINFLPEEVSRKYDATNRVFNLASGLHSVLAAMFRELDALRKTGGLYHAADKVAVELHGNDHAQLRQNFSLFSEASCRFLVQHGNYWAALNELDTECEKLRAELIAAVNQLKMNNNIQHVNSPHLCGSAVIIRSYEILEKCAEIALTARDEINWSMQGQVFQVSEYIDIRVGKLIRDNQN